MDNGKVVTPSADQNQFKIELNNVPIHWELNKGSFTFFGIKSVLFWKDPSLLNIIAPLAKELGVDMFRLLVADSTSEGTKEDYLLMVNTMGNTFEEGFLGWGRAISAAGWGTFELPECNYPSRKATVIVRNAWEVGMQSQLPENERWGCPFLQGKIIGLFSQAFAVNCWADEYCDYNNGYVQFSIYQTGKTIHEELLQLRELRMEERERALVEQVRLQTIDLAKAHNRLEAYSHSLEKKVEERTQELELLLEILREEKQKLKKMAAIDPLTGLLNRRAFYEEYKLLIKKRQDDKKTDSLIMLDIDSFKSINDRYGHAGGDHVLIEFSTLLKATFYPHDIYARFGGEEFIVICTDLDITANPAPLHRFLKIIEEHPLYFEGQSFNITASAGATLIEHQDINLDKAIKAADLLLYKAKKNGRNQAIIG
ncbi:GGDEF domain-containing protein [Psychromonas sp.]|uniref:GGDEF domain-containing protein n=1 Tax=Psychromonas sp. TaxID=1884585 RepID=UPI00356960CC